MAVAAAESYPRQQEAELIHRQKWMDSATWLAETLDGHMRTTIPLEYRDNELYSDDGREMSVIFRNAIDDAYTLAEKSPNLMFEIRRRHTEMQELDEMFEMAEGNKPNTMVVISDFPAELYSQTKNIGGFDVNRKQTWMRVIHLGTDGILRVMNQSLDRSERKSLEAIYGYFGLQPQPGELLGQRINLDLPDEEAQRLPDILTEVYDGDLSGRYGGKWYAGIRSHEGLPPSVETFDFVCNQTDIIAALIDAEANDSTDVISRIGIAELLRDRYQEFKSSSQSSLPGLSPKPLPRIPSNPISYRDVMYAAERAIVAGRIPSGCGMSVGGGPGDVLLSGAGYGNQTTGEEDYDINQLDYCRKCQAPPKKGEKMKLCGPCKICRDCDPTK